MGEFWLNVALPILGYGATVLATRLGWKVPGIVAPPTPRIDPEVEAFQSYVIKARQGLILLDNFDRDALVVIKTHLDALVNPAPALAPQRVAVTAPAFPPAAPGGAGNAGQGGA